MRIHQFLELVARNDLPGLATGRVHRMPEGGDQGWRGCDVGRAAEAHRGRIVEVVEEGKTFLLDLPLLVAPTTQVDPLVHTLDQDEAMGRPRALVLTGGLVAAPYLEGHGPASFLDRGIGLAGALHDEGARLIEECLGVNRTREDRSEESEEACEKAISGS